MKIGVVGPAHGDTERLRRAAETLLLDLDATKVVYLGLDDTADQLMATWQKTGFRSRPGHPSLTDSAAKLASDGQPQDLRALLRSSPTSQRYRDLQKVAAPPARCLEMVDERLVMLVNSASTLDADDIGSAGVVVFGDAQTPLIKRFGPRCFFSPGPASSGFGAIEAEEGAVVLSLYDTEGEPLRREPLLSRTSRLTVTP